MQITVERKTTLVLSAADVVRALKQAFPESLHIQALGENTRFDGKGSLTITSVKTDAVPG